MYGEQLVNIIYCLVNGCQSVSVLATVNDRYQWQHHSAIHTPNNSHCHLPFTDLSNSSSQLVTLEEQDEHYLEHLVTLMIT